MSSIICNMKYILLFLLSFPVYAGQLTYTEAGQTRSNGFITTSQDRELQLNFGDKQYFYLSVRQMSVCPYYCGFLVNMAGIGLGSRHQTGSIILFSQVGYYFINPVFGFRGWDENMYYYLNHRFSPDGAGTNFTSYEVRMDNALTVKVGLDIPITKHFGTEVAYQYLKIKQNFIGYLNQERTSLWWDPQNMDYSSFNAGVYYRW